MPQDSQPHRQSPRHGDAHRWYLPMPIKLRFQAMPIEPSPSKRRVNLSIIQIQQPTKMRRLWSLKAIEHNQSYTAQFRKKSLLFCDLPKALKYLANNGIPLTSDKTLNALPRCRFEIWTLGISDSIAPDGVTSRASGLGIEVASQLHCTQEFLVRKGK